MNYWLAAIPEEDQQWERISNKLRWYPQQLQRFIFTNLSETCCEAKRWKPCWTCWNLSWPCTKDSQNLLRDLLRNLLRNPLNLTWLCTKASWELLRNVLRNPAEPLNLTWLCTKASRNLLRNLERDLALHQRLPDLLRNLHPNSIEPDLALSLPVLLRNLTWLCTKAS